MNYTLTYPGNVPISIAFDLDGVIIDLMNSFIKMFNDCKNTAYTVKDIKDYDLYKSLNITWEETQALFNVLYNADANRIVKPIEGAAEFFTKHAENFDTVLFITMRPSSSYTHAWIKYHLPMIKHWELCYTISPQEKYKALKENQIDYFVDDSPNVHKHLLNAGFTGIIRFIQPWNNYIEGLKASVENWTQLDRVLYQTSLVDSIRDGSSTIPCTICKEPTIMYGTKLCHRCWELKSRIESDPDIALRIMYELSKLRRENTNDNNRS